MSTPRAKRRSPPEKKRLRLTRDRRNAYGESPHAARKNVPRAKARDHREARRVVQSTLLTTRGSLDSGAADELQTAATVKRHPRFKKLPDRPLGATIAIKHARRARSAARARARRTG